MSRRSTVAIVGSGFAGAAAAHALALRGHDVHVFEKGEAVAYPYAGPFEMERFDPGSWRRHTVGPADLKRVDLHGDYGRDLERDRVFSLGGTGTHWEGQVPRMLPEDFATRTHFGYGADWPLDYAALEPWYCEAETLLGVSGDDSDDPHAPPRSRPYPLPPFEFSYGDALVGTRLAEAGLPTHATPQARTRVAFDGRPACQNYGACGVCPIGARYSPHHHLLAAQATGRCRISTATSVRRLVMGDSGVRALVTRAHAAAEDELHEAQVVVLAGGAIENARLLLASRDANHPKGVGNGAGLVGRGFSLSHTWTGHLILREKLYSGRAGPHMGQITRFRDPPDRSRHGGVKVNVKAGIAEPPGRRYRDGRDVLRKLNDLPHGVVLSIKPESPFEPENRIGLASARDRFGDPFARVDYRLRAFAHESYAFARDVFQRIEAALAPRRAQLRPLEEFWSGGHLMGGCRMGRDEGEGVLDDRGRVFGVPNLSVLGASGFVGSSGSANPTLTLVAMALRSADAIARGLER